MNNPFDLQPDKWYRIYTIDENELDELDDWFFDR